MNLVLVRACSNSCPYCFEAAEREGGKQNLISMENVLRVAEWARQSDLGTLSLLGGEPFLHPQLGAIVKLLRKICPGTNLRILTGGIFRKQLIDTLSPEDAGLVFNINEPQDYINPKHYTKVINNVELAIRKGFHVVLGFNVWRMNFDTHFMPHLAHRLGRNNFCWTVANPIKDLPSKVINPSQYSKLADRCFDMLKEAARLEIDALIDCPLPYCFFSEIQLGWIAQYHPGTISGLGRCSPIMDVTPELEVLRCFALSESNRIRLIDFNNEWEIKNWFEKNVDSQLLKQGTFAFCSTCPHFIKGRCYGGCLACHEVTFEFESKPESLELIQEMNDALDQGNAELALNKFDIASPWSKTDISLFAAATASSKLGQWHRAFHLAAEAHHKTNNRELRYQIIRFIQSVPLEGFQSDTFNINQKTYPSFITCPQSETTTGRG
jgi:cyclic pyranopterin phosphate synthase